METQTFLELKRIALIDRGNKCIARINRPEYAVWKNHETTTSFIKLINLFVWALERSIRPDEWEPFRQALLGARYLLIDTFETEEAERTTYNAAWEEVEQAINDYIIYIQTHELVVIL